MNRYLEGETIRADELRDGRLPRDRRRDSSSRSSASRHARTSALKELLDLIADCEPEPRPTSIATARRTEEDEVELEPAEDGELVAQVFKTTNDLFMGKLSFLRIHSGRMTHDTTLVNLRTRQDRPSPATSTGSRARRRRRSTRRSPATSSRSPSSTTCTSPTRSPPRGNGHGRRT